MEIKIYIDILFLTNFFMDCALLLLSAKIIKRKTGFFKPAVSGVIGAAYSIFSFFSLIPFPDNLMKIAIGALMSFIAFSPRSFISFIKHTCIFYAVSFCFSGIAFALLYQTNFVMPHAKAIIATKMATAKNINIISQVKRSFPQNLVLY